MMLCLGTSPRPNELTIARSLLTQPLETWSISHTRPAGAKGGWLSSVWGVAVGRGSSTRGQSRTVLPWLRSLAEHTSRCVSECFCGRHVRRKVKKQPTSSLWRRAEQSRAEAGVGGECYICAVNTVTTYPRLHRVCTASDTMITSDRGMEFNWLLPFGVSALKCLCNLSILFQ